MGFLLESPVQIVRFSAQYLSTLIVLLRGKRLTGTVTGLTCKFMLKTASGEIVAVGGQEIASLPQHLACLARIYPRSSRRILVLSSRRFSKRLASRPGCVARSPL
jgi:hypothetical protein